MTLIVDHPEFHLAVPGQSRTQKAVWTRREVAMDIPRHRSADLVLALKYKHTAQQFVTEIYRIGTQHFRIAEFKFADTPAAIAGNATEMTSSALCRGAWEWFKKNVSIATPCHPDISYAVSSLVKELSDLPVFGELKLTKQDEDLRRNYENHMEMVRAGLLVIDGYLFEPCSEPVYVVTGYGSATVIEVRIEDRLPNSSIAVFPLGRYEDAIKFAQTMTQGRGLQYGEIISGVIDCGSAIQDNTEIASLRNAASVAAARFESVHAGSYAASYQALALLQTVPLEDIALYRNLKRLSEGNEISEETADHLFNALDEARNSAYGAQVFTDSNRFPLAEVLSLWEDRPISLPSAAHGNGPK
jgi:hypothetical protein